MSNNTIAMILHDLYDGFDFGDEGEDYNLSSISDNDREVMASAHSYWKRVNEARRNEGVEEWDSILLEAVLAVRIETDPNLQTDRLLELAATAISYASSVQRQTEAFNEEEGE